MWRCFQNKCSITSWTWEARRMCRLYQKSWCLLRTIPALDGRIYYVMLMLGYLLPAFFLLTLCASSPTTAWTHRWMRRGRFFWYHNSLKVARVVLYNWCKHFAVCRPRKSWYDHKEASDLMLAGWSLNSLRKSVWAWYGISLQLWLYAVRWPLPSTEHHADIWWAGHWWCKDISEMTKSHEKIVDINDMSITVQ